MSRRRIGKAAPKPEVQNLDPVAGATAAQPQRVVPQYKLYIVYYYEKANGDSGFSNVVLKDFVDIETEQAMADMITFLTDRDGATSIQLVNWKQLRG